MVVPQILVTVLFISGVAGQDPQTIRTVRQLIATLDEDGKTFGRELLQVLHSRDILSDLKEEVRGSDACSDKLLSLFSKLDMESFGFLDAAGKPGPGIMDGNFLWLGNYDSCHTIQAANGSNEHYENCQLKAPVVATTVLTWSGCMPQECRTTADVYPLLKQLTTLVAKYTNNTVNLDPDTMQLVCDVEQTYDAGAYVAVMLIALFGSLVAIGSVWYLMEPVVISFLNRHQDDLKRLIEDDTQIQANDYDHSPVQQNQPQSYVGQFFKCFALQKTFETLTNTDSKPGQVLCLNGIRVLSINWVVLGHFYLFLARNANYTKYFGVLLDKRSFSVVVNALPSVDSFFTMSGFLVCYLILKQLTKKGHLSPVQWISFYVHRYIRLTVPYLIAILLQGFLYRLMVTGPRAQDTTGATHSACSDFWWTNILYINNLYPWEATDGANCIGQGWYLANDMQFFFVAPAFIVLIFHKPLLGIITTVGAIGGSAIASAVITASYHLGPNTIIGGNPEDYWLMYNKPWTRITPYLVGILGGWFYWAWGKQIKKGVKTFPAWLKLMTATPIWFLTAAIQYGIVFGLFNDLTDFVSFGKKPSEADSVFYQSLARIGWSLSLMIQVLICEVGLGGFINSGLSWRGWTMLGRLTYSVFLLHMGLSIVLGGGARHGFSLSPDFECAVFYLGYLTMAYLAGAVLYLVVEQPVANLENITFRKSNN